MFNSMGMNDVPLKWTSIYICIIPFKGENAEYVFDGNVLVFLKTVGLWVFYSERLYYNQNNNVHSFYNFDVE